MKKILFGAFLCAILCSCGVSDRLSLRERRLIHNSDSLMRVLVIDKPSDYRILRKKSIDFSDSDLQSPLLKELGAKMLVTVNDPDHQGVGIAGPQVGLNRRIVAVKRYDKEGDPFEVYANIYLETVGDEIQCGPEGCLSIPGRRAMVNRHAVIKITYTDPVTLEKKSEIVDGFTAVIFQHETDHLEGILYIDRI